MRKGYRFLRYLGTVLGNSEEEARNALIEELKQARAMEDGYEHSDGEVRRCLPPPDGMHLQEIHTLLGRCDNCYNEQDAIGHYYAIPNDTSVRIDSKGNYLLPRGSLRWHTGQWQNIKNLTVPLKKEREKRRR